MHILNVNAVLDPVTGGGTAERTVQISNSLVKVGIQCSVMSTDCGVKGKKIDKLENVSLHIFPCLNQRFYIPMVSYSTIKKILKDVDVVHIMGHWTILNALVYLAVRSIGKPYVVCPAGALPIFGRSKIIKKLYNVIIGNNIIKNANAFIAITNDEREQFKQYNVDINKIMVIPNGIDKDDFQKGGEYQFRYDHRINDAPFILFLGRLNIIKGPDLLLKAFKLGQGRWKDWHLVYAGPDGGLLNTLQQSSDYFGLTDRIHFIGYVGGVEKSAAYHAANMLVIPSRQEAMSIVVLEAGISSTPVVLTDKCGFDEIQDSGGAIVCKATEEDICNSINQLISQTNSLDGMGANLKEYIEARYTWDVVIKKYIELYSNV